MQSGQLVAAFIIRMPGVSSDPLAPDRVLLDQIIKDSPEICICHWLVILSADYPSALTPAMTPDLNSFRKVSAVRNEQDFARLFKSLQALDRGLQFHPVVGGLPGLPASTFDDMLAVPQGVGPAARTRVTNASTVRGEGHMLHSTMLFGAGQHCQKRTDHRLDSIDGRFNGVAGYLTGIESDMRRFNRDHGHDDAGR